MDILVYSDVHGNLPAFEKVLETEKCQAHICLGDLVNYGPWSNECVDLALSLPNSLVIKGNHEQDFLDNRYSGSNDLARLFFDTTIQSFDRHGEIARFPSLYRYLGFLFLHTINQGRIYPDTSITLDENYFIGHSHHQFSYTNSGFWLHNPGSVGQNRKDVRVSNYMVVCGETLQVRRGSVEHDIKIVISKMRSLNYPAECIEYYVSKAL